jgi:hypothetical protein
MAAEAMFYRRVWDLFGLNPIDVDKIGADRLMRWLAVHNTIDEIQSSLGKLEGSHGAR